MDEKEKKMKLDSLKKLKNSMKKVASKKIQRVSVKSGPALKQMTDGTGVASINPSYPGFKDPK